MNGFIKGLVMAAALVPALAFATEGEGGYSDEELLDPRNYVVPAGVQVLPSTYEGTPAGFVMGTVTEGSEEGALAFDRASRRYDYADSGRAYSGIVRTEDLEAARAGTIEAYAASKKPGGSVEAPEFLLVCSFHRLSTA